MPQKLLTQKNGIIAGIIVFVLLALGGYYWYNSTSQVVTPSGKVNPSYFSPQIKTFYSVKDSLNLDDTFMKGKNEEFFNRLKNYSQDFPLKEPLGRPNPFVPYAAP